MEEETTAPSPLATNDESDLIKFRIEYVGGTTASVFFDDLKSPPVASTEPQVLEYVEVRRSGQQELSPKLEDLQKTEKGKGHAYINILSPAVMEALRCVVPYFPDIDFSGNVIKIPEPYSIIIFYEKELTEYRERIRRTNEGISTACPNQWADKHIGIVQDFVSERMQDAVDAERERHSRGYVTFDMLWLLFKPGADVYYDLNIIGEREPYIMQNIEFELTNGATNSMTFTLWNLDANADWVGPGWSRFTVNRFPGEKEIISMQLYPCEFLKFENGVGEEDLAAIQRHFTKRGKKWYNLRRGIGTYQFDGFTTSFPRRAYTSLAVVDTIQYRNWQGSERRNLLAEIKHPSSPMVICGCNRCEEHVYKLAVQPKFSGYSQINPLTVAELTEHQYFLCDQMVEVFLFKIRAWDHVHVDGIQEASFDGGLFERLVMKDETKDLIKNLTQTYIRDATQLGAREKKLFKKVTEVHKDEHQSKGDSTWSADFVEGKGEGLTILLHGKPGVGKTYTAECISNYTERPLLSLTCSDIGVKPEDIEGNLRKWFKVAEIWGAILLIDEADIYMEQRQVQDVERNHLVAGFLRALEYYKGILFITTNRVGTFDEAFMSRIHVQIHYPDFEDEQRDKLWDIFFQKLEDERETTMRIMQSARDYVETEEMRALKWNGREIRNSFQVAVALAVAQGEKDNKGRICIKREHIKATVQMSKEFRDYLTKVHKVDLSKRASLLGNRYDAYGKDGQRSSKY